jgi:hypothetical protein
MNSYGNLFYMIYNAFSLSTKNTIKLGLISIRKHVFHSKRK